MPPAIRYGVDMKLQHYDPADYPYEHVPNPGPEPVTWQQYYGTRNLLVDVCRRHGTTGPLGRLTITDEEEEGDDWEFGDDDCRYFIINDMYNTEDRYVYMELIDSTAVTRGWLDDVCAMLADTGGWAVGVHIVEDGYMLIFADRLMVTGPRFAGCQTVDDAVRSLQRTD